MDPAKNISPVEKPRLSLTSFLVVISLVLITGGLLGRVAYRSDLPSPPISQTSVQKVVLQPSDPLPTASSDPAACVRHLATVVEESDNESKRLIDVYPAAAESGCMHCHAEIEMIREHGAEMLEQIMELGAEIGDPAGCVVCHGGDAATKDKEKAHGKVTGKFFPDPGSPWINKETCGQCHPDQVEAQWRSLMMTEAGKIQGVCWAFGGLTGYKHKFGNYAVKNPKDPKARLGTDEYRKYMERLTALEPDCFVDEHLPVPDALQIDELHKLKEDPSLAGFTYLRQECQRCHHAVKGRKKRGDYRGMGCSSCHIPYSNEGLYEGDDKTIDREDPGHMLVHSLQGTREAKVTIHGVTYSGIPVETCTTCHDRGKRIGVSFQGLMETPFKTPLTDGGQPQPSLHSKHYIAMEQDIHYQRGMTCQDCHTTMDVHGDNFLAAANLAAVQIECADCHGTPESYPWELPLGFMDEFKMEPATGAQRGLAKKIEGQLLQGTVYDAEDGYLLSARGNPLGNVVRRGDDIVVHTAAGADLVIMPLKKIYEEGLLSVNGKTAMVGVSAHLERMECYSCHSSWTPQCYGCHVKIDFCQGDACPETGEVAKTDSANKQLAKIVYDTEAWKKNPTGKHGFDWVAAGRKHQEPEHAADRGEYHFDTIIPGKVTEDRSYMRWEEPMLGINGEGRVSPLAPGCQPSVTVIGPDGEPIVTNHIYKLPAGLEHDPGGGQLAIDMSPVQPHTTSKYPRSCESCHASEKALGLGLNGGRSFRPLNEDIFVDIETVDGKILPKKTQPQFTKIENLDHDWSQIVDRSGQQVATVGHHFKLSRAFNSAEMDHISREGTCVACHQELPKGNLATSFLHHVAKYSGQLPETHDAHDSLVHKIVLMSAWVQLLGVALVGLLVVGVVFRWRRKRK